MKKIMPGFIFLFFSICGFAQNTPKTLSRLISYSVDIKWTEQSDSLLFTDAHYIYSGMENGWYIRNLFSGDRKAFIKAIHDSACSGNLTVYESYYVDGDTPIFSKMPLNDVRVLLDDTVFTQETTTYPPYDVYQMVTISQLDIMTEVDALDFLERWTYNPETFEFHKQVIAFAPCIKRYDDKKVYRGLKALYWIKCEPSH